MHCGWLIFALSNAASKLSKTTNKLSNSSSKLGNLSSKLSKTPRKLRKTPRKLSKAPSNVSTSNWAVELLGALLSRRLVDYWQCFKALDLAALYTLHCAVQWSLKSSWNLSMQIPCYMPYNRIHFNLNKPSFRDLQIWTFIHSFSLGAKSHKPNLIFLIINWYCGVSRKVSAAEVCVETPPRLTPAAHENIIPSNVANRLDHF